MSNTIDSSLPRSHVLLGFFQSIALRAKNSLQDTLRLITLWFKFGGHEDVCATIVEKATTVSIDTWLEVIPQVRLLLGCVSSACHTHSPPRS